MRETAVSDAISVDHETTTTTERHTPQTLTNLRAWPIRAKEFQELGRKILA